jgi:hypothetical protein
MFHVSLNPLFSEVIIRKNIGIGPEQLTILRRELVRSHLAMLQRPKWGWDGVGEVAGAGGRVNIRVQGPHLTPHRTAPPQAIATMAHTALFRKVSLSRIVALWLAKYLD